MTISAGVGLRTTNICVILIRVKVELLEWTIATSFPTLLPFRGAGKFMFKLTLCPLQNFFTHILSFIRHRVAFMRMWIGYYFAWKWPVYT